MYGAITSAQRIRITARIITLRNNTVSHSNPFGEYSAASTKNSIEWKTGSRAAPRFVRLRFVVRRMGVDSTPVSRQRAPHARCD